QSKMIGPAGQIAAAAAGGAALCAWGFRRHVRGALVTRQVLTGAGIILLFLSVFASFSVYRLLTPLWAAVYLTVLMAQAAALAVLYRSQTIAYLAAVGALLTPLLIQTEGDPYATYFLYLAVLNAAVQGIFALRPWPGLRALALVGTEALFWLWFTDRYHPEKANTVVLFHVILAAICLVPDWLAARVRRSRAEDWVMLIAVPW